MLLGIHPGRCGRQRSDLTTSSVQIYIYFFRLGADLQARALVVLCRLSLGFPFGTRATVRANDYETNLSSTRCVINGHCQSWRNISAALCRGLCLVGVPGTRLASAADVLRTQMR